MEQLVPGDQVAIVLFSYDACTPLPLTPVECLDIGSVQADISRDVVPLGGTNEMAGLQMAADILTNCSHCLTSGLENVENRIILMTDEQPNVGDVSSSGFSNLVEENAQKNIYLTVIGTGLDFNTDLVEHLANTQGANYYSFHRPGEFQQRLVTDFNYTVTPLVFNLTLSVDQSTLANNSAEQGWRILSVYGSPNPNDTAYSAVSPNGTVSRVNTLFPSPKTEQGIKGGVMLLRVAPPTGGLNAVPLVLDVSYTDRSGNTTTSKRSVDVSPQALGTANGTQYFQSTGVRKAVLLARYTDLLRNWLIDEWRQINATGVNKTVVVPSILCSVFPASYCANLPAADRLYNVIQVPNGCDLGNWLSPYACILPTPVPVFRQLGEWERQSQNLTGHVNANAKQSMKDFLPYMQSEINALNDTSLQEEVDILNKIIAA